MQPRVELRPATGPAPAGGIPVTSLRLERTTGWPVGQAEAVLSGLVTPPEPGTTVTVAAAADAGESPAVIFSGLVLRSDQGPRGSRVILEEATGPLTRLRVDATYQSSTAGSVIQDLAGRASVPVSVDGTGAELPFFAVLSSHSAMDYIASLALLSGFRLATAADGTLRALETAPAGGSLGSGLGGAAAGLTAMAGLGSGSALGPGSGPVLGLVDCVGIEAPPGPIVFGDGAYTSQGAGAESWLLKDPSPLQAGDGPAILLLPGLKTPANVKTAAAGQQKLVAEARQAKQLLLAGPPPADLAEVITLKGFAHGDGPARVAGIRVIWHAATGLQTRLLLHGAG